MKTCDICGNEKKTQKAKRDGETLNVCEECLAECCEDCKTE